MKRLYFLLCFVFSIALCSAQGLNIWIEDGVREQSEDLDAKVYFPKYDLNDELCALVKVSLTRSLKNPLVLEVGGLGVVARQEKESGEIWFYLPAQVKNLSFKCAEYVTPSPIPVNLNGGTVYRVTLNPDAVFETVANAVLSTNYLKIEINEPNSTISLGLTDSYELMCQSVDGEFFSQLLEYGDYYYKIEHPLYETYYGRVGLDATTSKQKIDLVPAYGYLHITSSPSGADVYMAGRKVGTTPCTIEERVGRGDVELRVELEDYYSSTFTVNVKGDGGRQSVSRTLKPRFAEVTLECSDSEAELWVDNEFKGVGRWSGRLNSLSSHYVESRRAGHRSQSLKLSVKDGDVVTQTIQSPVAMYGTLNITTTPPQCEISVDGKVVGESPYIGQVLVGDHTIKLSLDGYAEKLFDVTIEHNRTLTLSDTLQKRSHSIPKETNKLVYTTSDGKIITPKSIDATIVSNRYEDGQGVIVFDRPITSIGIRAFADCTTLTSITIPDGVTLIESRAFYCCTRLTSISIPDSVTFIGRYAFEGCSVMTSITIPTNVTLIGYCAFYNCSNLVKVYCKSKIPPYGNDFMFDNNARGRKIYVPASSVNAYKRAEYWKSYANYIVGYGY